ncbi:MAG: hypothetical protein AB8F65_06150 [Woeseiaceae bacterium]
MTERKAMLPLVVAVTGHRDLVGSEMTSIREALVAFFSQLKRKNPHRQIRLMSGLAEGADQLAAEVALEHGAELFAVLPMASTDYADDFASDECQQRFEYFLSKASETIELPPANAVNAIGSERPQAQRDIQYAQLGVFLCAHCHILLALWDGKFNNQLGGTGQVVRFHHDDRMPGFEDRGGGRQQMLIDDESDLVYHIVCSRDRVDGQPATGLEAVSAGWYTKDASIPRGRDLPLQHAEIFARSGEFSSDANRHIEAIKARAYPLIDAGAEQLGIPGLADIDRLFCQADVLAMIFQRRTLIATRLMHGLAFLMGLCFLAYADLNSAPGFLIVFLVLFGVSTAIQFVGRRHQWHRKYLDYRALAEGLRVQFFWAASGVAHESATHFPHDNFLQMQDPELGWIRNVMRVAGLRCNAFRHTDKAGIGYVRETWIGDKGGGQLAYFDRGMQLRVRRSRLTEALGKLSLMTSVCLVALFIVAGSALPDSLNDPLLALMGALLLAYAIREGYAYALAEKELIKQYRFMFRLFQNSKQRLDSVAETEAQRQILWALGKSALDEHGEWLMLHRSRSVDDAELWRLGS